MAALGKLTLHEDGVRLDQTSVAFILPGVISNEGEGTEQTRRKSEKNQ